MLTETRPTSPAVALTIDCEYPDRAHFDHDGPSKILQVLDELNVVATFFIEGRWAAANAKTALRIAEDGHEIGNHGYSHAKFPLFTDVGLRRDIEDACQMIEEVTGVDSRPLLRPPHGEGIHEDRIRTTAGELGYQLVHWDTDTCDWDHGQTPTTFADNATSGTLGIMLMHSWPDLTPLGLYELVNRLRTDGVDFVTTSEALALGMGPSCCATQHSVVGSTI